MVSWSSLHGGVVISHDARPCGARPVPFRAEETRRFRAIGPGPTNSSFRNPGAANSSNTLRLGTGDLVEVSVYNVPELSTKARVSSEGDIYLPLVDYVRVGGLTADEAQALIQKRLSDGGFVKNPHVSVFVQEYASQGASVLGEVARPGIYPVLGQQRLFDVISAAGGFTEKAGQSITVTHRDHVDKPVTVPLTRNATDSPEGNIAVFPGDTIVVRKADVVYVVGEVGTAERIPDGQWTFDRAASNCSGRRDDPNRQTERGANPSQGPSGNQRDSGGVEEDPGSEVTGHGDGGGRHPVCPHQRGQGRRRAYHGRCLSDCQRIKHCGGPLERPGFRRPQRDKAAFSPANFPAYPE